MSNNGSQQFEFHPLELSQLDAVLALEQEALDNLERPDLLRRNTLDMWHKCLQPPHLCLGAWVRGELVGFAVLYVPAKGDGPRQRSRRPPPGPTHLHRYEGHID